MKPTHSTTASGALRTAPFTVELLLAAWLVRPFGLSGAHADAAAVAATLTVTTTADSGAGSLRQAILDANTNAGADAITFAIGAVGSQQTIQPTSALPTITGPVTIDGWSQGGAVTTGPPLIELNGALAGSSGGGLTITGGDSTVRGLVINGFIGQFASGIRLQTGGGNWIDIGIFQGGSDHNFNTVYGRVTANGAGVGGIRIGYFHWAQGQGCQQSSPTWQNLETTSDIDGNYKLLTHMLPGNGITYCIAARPPTGYQQSYNPATPATGSNFSYQTTGGAMVYNPGYWERAITLAPAAMQARSQANGAVVRWSAFRDDNLNDVWDEDEPALTGVSLGSDSSGAITGLADGPQTLAVTPPAGYAFIRGEGVALWLNGADVLLPPLAFRFAGALHGQVFGDDDGDGWLRRGESGAPGATISLAGPAQATAVTDQQGRFSLPNLPDGNYTVSVTPPAGHATVPQQTIVLNDGGALTVALQPMGQLSGAIYDDWDGDRRRGADEPAVITPITVNVAGVGTQRTALGLFRFGNVPNGSYTIAPWWQATNPMTATSTAGGVQLPAVPAGIVRGTAWLDANGDGIRQPWETPLTGMLVTVAGQTVATDEQGRYAFYGIVAGTYTLTAHMPAGLTAQLGPVVVSAGRGAVLGIGAVEQGGAQLYLPVVLRP